MVPGLGLNAGFSHQAPFAGDVAFLSQSGALITAIVDWARGHGIGFSHIVSLGDMADADFGDLLDYLAGDTKSRAILLYMEAVTHARKFLSAARRAARSKPVIVVKAGREATGAKAALSHTGALAAGYLVAWQPRRHRRRCRPRPLHACARCAAGGRRFRREYAILVRSDLKERGLGWHLMQHLIAYARAERTNSSTGACWPGMRRCCACVAISASASSLSPLPRRQTHAARRPGGLSASAGQDARTGAMGARPQACAGTDARRRS
jgi:GNAT superfamily N-acetyltransferase